MIRGCRLGWCFALIIVTQLMMGCTGSLQSSQSIHLAFGSPSHSPSQAEDYLLIKPQYVLSYNPKLGRANWASWQLDTSWLGTVSRQNDFRPDDSLPKRWPQITPLEYRSSGYDRGHLVPSGDRTRTITDNSSTFLMTNIIPQTPANNRGPWEDLERDCRLWASTGKSLWIVAGGIGGLDAIGKRNLIIPPQDLWKVVLVTDSPTDQPSDIQTSTTVLAVIIPNKNGIETTPWTEYQVSVDTLEAKTGYDFFSKIDPAVQRIIESKLNSFQQNLHQD